MKEITVSELKERMKKDPSFQIVDVRQPEEFEEGHIPGSKLIPLGELPERLTELNPETPYVIVCRSGARSGRACEFLEGKGFKSVENLIGGNLKWRSET